MLIQQRFCRRCGFKTYHKYLNCLRHNVTSCSQWKCIDCGKTESAGLLGGETVQSEPVPAPTNA